jgi:hypothetical protein
MPSLVAQRLDRVELRRFPRRVEAEDNPERLRGAAGEEWRTTRG